MIFFSSDWHLWHKNIIRFDDRPYRDLEHMHESLVENYNVHVKDEDTCYFAGDMSFAKANRTLPIIGQLKGKKILILGNHDGSRDTMIRSGFDIVLNGVSLGIAGEIVTITHCPLRGVFREDVSHIPSASSGEHWHGEQKLGRYSLPDFGQYHLHGHTHKPPEERIVGRQMDIGVRANGYRPVPLSAVEGWITRQEASKIV